MRSAVECTSRRPRPSPRLCPESNQEGRYNGLSDLEFMKVFSNSQELIPGFRQEMGNGPKPEIIEPNWNRYESDADRSQRGICFAPCKACIIEVLDFCRHGLFSIS